MPEGLPLLMDRARIALRTQQIFAYETGATNTTDSVAGSEYIDNLTDEIEDGVKRILDEIEEDWRNAERHRNPMGAAANSKCRL